MKQLNRPLGCGLWLVWLLLGLFAGEWLLLWFVLQMVPAERLALAVLAVVIAAIIGGWVAVYFRVQPQDAMRQAASSRRIRNPESRIQDRESGVSLVELLVALAIMASTLVTLVAALSTAAFGVRASNRLTTATNLAASQLESIKADGYSDVVSGDYSRVAAPPDYTIAVSRSEISAGLLQVTVTVSYQGETRVVVSNYKVDR